MIKLIELFNEIKVNQPGKIFQLTDKVKDLVKSYNELNTLIQKFGIEDYVGLMEDSELYLDILNISVFEDEKILKINEPNNIDEFVDGLINKLGWYEDKKDAKELIDDWVKKGWINKVII